MYDFRCSECSQTFETFARIEETSGFCPDCGALARRLISTPRIALDGTDPAFTTEWDRWAKKHEQAAKRAYARDDIGGRFHGDN